MKRLQQYINENFDSYLKLSLKEKEKLLELDKLFNSLLVEYEKEHVHFANVENISEQIDNILESVKNDKDFSINLKYEDSKFSDKEWCDNLLNKLNELKQEFINLDIYLTKFYCYRIDKTIESILFFEEYSKHKIFPKFIVRPSKQLYEEALKIINTNKFVDVKSLKDDKYKRNKDPEYSRKRLQGIIDKFGYGWKVIIDDNMIPRMSVRPYKEFRISKTNKFSEVDLQSLEVHEIEVHTARKYYALQSGLFLFLYGLKGNNCYDEGMAIYNSLNKTETQKPNILFFISIKIIILYHLNILNNIELFKFLRTLTNAPDKTIALAMIRASRVFAYSNINTASTDSDYLKGYLLVKDMTDKEREELLHYTIGPDQLFELETIKKFFKINKFKPLENFETIFNDNEEENTY